MTPMEIDLPWLSAETSRHGKPVLYVRRGSRRIRMHSRPGQRDFLEEYRAALARIETGDPKPAPRTFAARWPRGTLGWLVDTYYRECAAFRRMQPVGQTRRRTRLDALCDKFGDKPALMTRQAILAGQARRSATPGAANDWLKDIKSLYRWALDAGYVASNPAASIGALRLIGDGFHTWTLDELTKFLERFGPGTPARRACLFILASGLRRGDAVAASRTHLSGARLRYRASKNREPVDITLPPFVMSEIGPADRSGDLAILTQANGRRFASGASFGNWFKDRCGEAGLPHCTAHGLRKALATIAAENGASEHAIMALLADRDPNQARTYTRAARQQILVAAGQNAAFAPIQTMIANVAPKPRDAEGATKTLSNPLKS